MTVDMLRKVWRVTRILLLSLVGLILILVIGALSYRAIRQHQNAAELTIHTPNGIDEAMFVSIGGINQWITIRGQNRDNPVVLFLHGGPGEASNLVDYSAFKRWTPEFTIVQWDQRGAGKTFGSGGTSITDMTIDRMTQDGADLADLLRKHLHKDKIIILGHSWGTILGIHMVKARPDLFYAYVGTGQIVNVQRNEIVTYERTLERARVLGNSVAIDALQSIGPPPYRSMKDLQTAGRWGQEFEGATAYTNAELTSALFAPGYSLHDIYGLGGSLRVTLGSLVGSSLTGPMMSVDLDSLGPDFTVPMFVFEGPDDYITSPELAKAYVDTINAPKKEFVMLPAGGHFALFTHAETFAAEMNSRVRPLAARQP
jgi:pimeloyl-ACP methyl ester carboxylesterase